MLGDFPKAVDDAILGSNEAHQEQMMQLLSDPKKAAGFARVVFELLQEAGGKSVGYENVLHSCCTPKVPAENEGHRFTLAWISPILTGKMARNGSPRQKNNP